MGVILNFEVIIHQDGAGSMIIEIDHPELANLHNHWVAQAGTDRLPGRAAFTPETLRPWLGHIGIVEVERDPLRLRVRLAGVHLVEHDGHDHTGRYLHDVVPPAEREMVLGSYLRCLDERTPTFESFYTRPDPNRRCLVRRLLLPLSADGREVDQIITGFYSEQVQVRFRG